MRAGAAAAMASKSGGAATPAVAKAQAVSDSARWSKLSILDGAWAASASQPAWFVDTPDVAQAQAVFDTSCALKAGALAAHACESASKTSGAAASVSLNFARAQRMLASSRGAPSWACRAASFASTLNALSTRSSRRLRRASSFAMRWSAVATLTPLSGAPPLVCAAHSRATSRPVAHAARRWFTA